MLRRPIEPTVLSVTFREKGVYRAYLLHQRKHGRRGTHPDYKFRFIDQPQGWLGEKTHPDVPYITNLRLDPFERMGWPGNGSKDGAQQYFDWFKFQFWRFVFVQQVMAKEIQTFLDFPPMQRGASTLTPSRRRWRNGWPRQRQKAPASNRNDLFFTKSNLRAIPYSKVNGRKGRRRQKGSAR